MNVLLKHLHDYFCSSYRPESVPEHLRSNPMKACSQYSFETGLRLGMQLAFTCLDPDMLYELNLK